MLIDICISYISRRFNSRSAGKIHWQYPSTARCLSSKISIPAVRVRYMKKKFKFFEMISVSIPAVRVRYIPLHRSGRRADVRFNSRSAGKIHAARPTRLSARFQRFNSRRAGKIHQTTVEPLNRSVCFNSRSAGKIHWNACLGGEVLAGFNSRSAGKIHGQRPFQRCRRWMGFNSRSAGKIHS